MNRITFLQNPLIGGVAGIVTSQILKASNSDSTTSTYNTLTEQVGC